MKDAFILFLALLVPIGCIATASYLVIHSKEGWGWFLFFSLLFMPSIKSRKDKKTDTSKVQ